jgi:hypothetical protein
MGQKIKHTSKANNNTISDSTTRRGPGRPQSQVGEKYDYLWSFAGEVYETVTDRKGRGRVLDKITFGWIERFGYTWNQKEVDAPPADDEDAPPADDEDAPPADDGDALSADDGDAPPADDGDAPPADDGNPPPANDGDAPPDDGEERSTAPTKSFSGLRGVSFNM